MPPLAKEAKAAAISSVVTPRLRPPRARAPVALRSSSVRVVMPMFSVMNW